MGGGPPKSTEGDKHAAQKADDEKGQAGCHENDDGRVQAGNAPKRIEDRPEGEVEGSGFGDRPLGERTVELASREAQEALTQQRAPDILTVRIHLLTGQWIDMGINVTWTDWVVGLNNWNGIAWDKGYIPRSAIMAIVHHEPDKSPDLSTGNVVPFTGAKK